MRRTALLLTAACMTAALAGCGGSPSAEDCQDPDISAETAQECLDIARDVASDALADESGDPAAEPGSAPELAGPATDAAVYPGGVTAEIASVEAEPAEAWVAEDNPGHDTRVRVTVRLTAGPDGYSLETGATSGPDGNLLYGPNLIEAQGWMIDQDEPSLVTEDSPVTLVEEFSLPADGLDQLVYEYTPASGAEQPWTFTEVEQLLN